MTIIDILQHDPQLLLLSTLVLGLVVGSFLNVVIYRLPIILNAEYKKECLEFLGGENKGEFVKKFGLMWPNSHCPECKKALRIRDNIPLVSFLLLRGKCANCAHKISWRYPLIELLTALLSILVVWKMGFSCQSLVGLLFVWALIAATFIDLAEQLLPDEITMGLLWLGLLASIWHVFVGPETAIIGAIVGYGSLWLIANLFKVLRKKDGLGHGDFKLVAAFGALFGWQLLPMTIFMASLLGSIVGVSLILFGSGKFDKRIPFGPYLAIAGVVAMLYGRQILHLMLVYF